MNADLYMKLYESLVEKLHECVVDISFEDFSSIQTLLIVKSVNDEQFSKVLDLIKRYNFDLDIFVVGEYYENIWVDETHFLHHEGRFNNVVDISLKDKVEIINPDVVMYISHWTYRASYINVMNYVNNLYDNAPIFAYAYDENRLIKHSSLSSFIESLLNILDVVKRMNNMLSDS